MTTWIRATVSTQCGACNAIIAIGQPAQYVRLPGIQRVRYRCEACAGPAPPDLPAVTDPPAVTLLAATTTAQSRAVFESAQAIAGRLPIDFRARAAGDREPGEEG